MLYIKAKLKIIENKIFKYHLSQADNNKQKIQIAHCFSYANNIQNDFILLTSEISDNPHLYDNNYYHDIEKRNYKIELFDDIIRCHFDYIYTMTLLHHKIGNFMEAISYLSLFLTLYKETKYLILSKHTLYKIEKCFILLSKIYISNEDYYNALLLLNESIKVCFKQIIYQVHELYFGVFIGEKEDLTIREKDDLLFLRDSKIKKIIFNIVVIFLYQGICNEDLANIKGATASYKQCEWFSRIFLSQNNETFYKFLFNLKKKGIIVCSIVDLIEERIKEKEAKYWKKKKEENYNGNKNKIFAMKKQKLYNTNKFKGLVKKLQELNIKEINTINKFEKTKNIRCLSSSKREGRRKGNYKNLYLSNIRLLEAYLRNDFKSIVLDMKKINIFDLDYRTRTKVQKTLNKIYFDQNQKLIREKNKSLINKSNAKSRNNINDEKDNLNNFKDLNLNKECFPIFNSNSKQMIKKYKTISINLSKYKFSKNNSFKNNSQEKENESHFNKIFKIDKKLYLSNREALSSPMSQRLNHSMSTSFLLNSSRYPNPNRKTPNKSKESKKEKNKTQSLSKISKFKVIIPENKKLNEFFNNKYQKKRDYIKKLTDRELLFQKSILKSKNTPKLSFEYFNKAESQQNADNSFSKIESLITNNLGIIEWKDLSDEEYKEYQLKNRLENALLSSLDNKALYNYKMHLKRIEKNEEKKAILED